MSEYSRIVKIVFLLLSLSSSSLFAEAIQGYRLIAGDDIACKGFKNYLNNFMGYSSVIDKSVSQFEGIPLKPEVVKLPNGIRMSPHKLDFNNDGKDEVYFRYDGGGSYLLGTILYVINQPEKLNSEFSNILKGDLHVFPCQYDNHHFSTGDCPTFSQKADEAGVLVSIGKESVFFRGRYTDIQILRKSQNNYLLLRSMSQDTIDYAAVVKPFGIKSYKSICILKR